MKGPKNINNTEQKQNMPFFCWLSVFETFSFLGVLNYEGAENRKKTKTKHSSVFHNKKQKESEQQKYVRSVLFGFLLYAFDTFRFFCVLFYEGAATLNKYRANLIILSVVVLLCFFCF